MNTAVGCDIPKGVGINRTYGFIINFDIRHFVSVSRFHCECLAFPIIHSDETCGVHLSVKPIRRCYCALDNSSIKRFKAYLNVMLKTVIKHIAGKRSHRYAVYDHICHFVSGIRNDHSSLRSVFICCDSYDAILINNTILILCGR